MKRQYMRSAICVVLILFQLLFQGLCQGSEPLYQGSTISYTADFSGSSRSWIGPHWWSNPPFDCYVRPPYVTLAAAPSRTAVLLPYSLRTGDLNRKNSPQPNRRPFFSISANLRFSQSSRRFAMQVAGGFRLGRKGDAEFMDWRRSVVAAIKYIDVLYYPGSGRLKLGLKHDIYVPIEKRNAFRRKVNLEVRCEQFFTYSNAMRCMLKLKSGAIEFNALPRLLPNGGTLFDGGISILTHGPAKFNLETSVKAEVSFSSFHLIGSRKLVRYSMYNTFGPLLWSQYLPPQNGILRVQAQLAYLPPTQYAKLYLRLNNKIRKHQGNADYNWKLVNVGRMNDDSKAVLFKLRIPRKFQGMPVIHYRVSHIFNKQTYHTYGRILTVPRNAKPRVAAFSCDNGYLFPNNKLVDQVANRRPDLLAFLGDQIYESGGYFGLFGTAGAFTPFKFAMQDFFYKYATFMWQWRNLVRKIPTVFLADDHDYFQGNIWGNSGAILPKRHRSWEQGGFMMSPRWVRAVENIYTGHFPPSMYHNMTLYPANIKTYFTSFIYGKLDFIILEDRKFKSAPSSSAKNKLELLGKHQEAYLEKWSKRWGKRTAMKVALSQTIFCSAATHRGYDLRRDVFYTDSGGWPHKGRKKAVKYLTNARAFSMHGDQHLGALVHNFANNGWKGKGQFALMVPGVANGFPRAWWPGVRKPSPFSAGGKKFTGRFIDDAGNAIQMLAVGNPNFAKKLPMSAKNNWFKMAYDKSSGWGLAEFNTQKREVTISMYRIGGHIKGEMFRGFPKKVVPGGGIDVQQDNKNGGVDRYRDEDFEDFDDFEGLESTRIEFNYSDNHQ